MRHLTKIILGILLLSAILPAWAQGPGGGGGRGGRGGLMRGGGGPEQLMGILAFDEKIAVTDEQLVKLRTELKALHQKQQETIEEMRNSDGDREEFFEQVMAMRDELLETTATVLSDTQMEALSKRIKEDQERRGRFGGGRGGRGGRGAQ